MVPTTLKNIEIIILSGFRAVTKQLSTAYKLKNKIFLTVTKYFYKMITF